MFKTSAFLEIFWSVFRYPVSLTCARCLRIEARFPASQEPLGRIVQGLCFSPDNVFSIRCINFTTWMSPLSSPIGYSIIGVFSQLTGKKEPFGTGYPLVWYILIGIYLAAKTHNYSCPLRWTIVNCALIKLIYIPLLRWRKENSSRRWGFYQPFERLRNDVP